MMFSSSVPEPVIEVPKIYTEDVPMGAVLRATQLAEQLVEVGPHSGSELSADFTPSTPAAYVVSDGPPTWIDGAGLTWWQSASGRWYLGRDPSMWWDAPG